MPKTEKLTLAEVLRRKAEVLSHRYVVDGFERWEDPERTNSDADILRDDIIRAIANGSKVPYALCRAIVDLPGAHYGAVAVGVSAAADEKVQAVEGESKR